MDRKKKKTSKVLENKIQLFIFCMFMLLINLSNIFAITSSGSDSANKIGIYTGGTIECCSAGPQGSGESNTCQNAYNQTSYTIAGVYLPDEVVKQTESELIDGEEIFETNVQAKDACNNFVKNNNNKEKTESDSDTYLCKEISTKTAYACTGKLDGIPIDKKEVLEKYIGTGVMFTNESKCVEMCSDNGGTCTIQDGYYYKYSILTTEETNNSSQADFSKIQGRVFKAQKADSKEFEYAFCIQPAKKFTCPYYYLETKEIIPQYCLNDTFDLSSCATEKGFAADYRCGLAYIALIGTNKSEEVQFDEDGNIIEGSNKSNNNYGLSNNQYAIIDFAMRMWANYKGNLAGTDSTNATPNGEKTTKYNYFGITARRADEDAFYINNGMKCVKSSKNIGLACTYEEAEDKIYSVYTNALKLFNMTLNVNKIDSAGNRVPTLVTKTIGNSTEIIQVTNPTSQVCETGDPNCKTTIKLCKTADCKDSEVLSGDTYCDKNFCYSKITSEKICNEANITGPSVQVEIKDFELSGSIREYKNCSAPEDNQIMIVIDAKGIETTKKETYVQKYKVDINCQCTDNSAELQTKIGYIKDGEEVYLTKDNSVHYCTNYENVNSKSSDYNDYEEGFIKDAPLSTILNSCPSNREYFRVKDYELGGETCKVYCRDEVDFYLANKEKVYSGMQFAYKLEEKIENTLASNKHITSVVYQKRECMSEVFYDKANPTGNSKKSWLDRYYDALDKVDDAWNEWKKWDVLKNNQEKREDYPTEWTIIPACSANCNAICDSGYDSEQSTKTVCENYNADINSNFIKTTDIVELATSCDINDKRTLSTSPNICTPSCSYFYRWTKQDFTKYNKYTYSKPNKLTEEKDYGYAESGDISTNVRLTCSLKGTVDYEVVISTPYTYLCHIENEYDEENDDRYNDRYDDEHENYYNATCTSYNLETVTGVFEGRTTISPDSQSESIDGGLKTCKEGKRIIEDSINRQRNSLINVYQWRSGESNENIVITPESGGNCGSLENGDKDYVIKTAKEKLAAYNAAQETVQKLLTELQNCNMYGSGYDKDGDTDIISYTLTKGSITGYSSGMGTGSSDSSGGNLANYGSVGGGGGGIKPTASNIIENAEAITLETDTDDDYQADTMLLVPENGYQTQAIATTNNSASIKKKILKGASCVQDNSCVELAVEYEDTDYGKLYNYKKVAGIIETSDLQNVYCKGDNCVLLGTNVEAGQNGWTYASNEYKQTIKRIVCDVTDEDHSNHKCELEDTTLPSSDYVSFKVTTEIDYYRDKNYYSQAYTGKVIESSTNTKVNSSQYAKLGNNLYVIANNKNKSSEGTENNRVANRNDKGNVSERTHYVKSIFTNVNVSAFGNNSDMLQPDSYNYACTYEVYNNTTGYDCKPEYDAYGNQITCVNECFDVEGNITDICVEWNNESAKTYGFVFRNVELANMFPSGLENRSTNWSNSTKVIEEIQSKGNDIYTSTDNLVLSVTLTPDSIKKIREYNRFKNTNSGGYLDNTLSECNIIKTDDEMYNYRFANCRSSFIDEVVNKSGVLGIAINKISSRDDKEGDEE